MDGTEEPITLPPGLDLLWGRREAGRRGPKAELSVDAIVAAAIAIANREGLGAVSMTRVAKDLGFTAMSLYRHVSSKDELLQLMWNASAAGVDDVELTGDSWRPRLRSWAMAQREAIERNTWIVQMPMATPPMAPNSMAWVEKGLAALDDTGLAAGEQMRVIGLLSAHSLIDAKMAFDARTSADAGEDPIDYAVVVRELVDAERFPRLHRLAWSGEIDDPPAPADPLAEYQFELEVILDGIAGLIDG